MAQKRPQCLDNAPVFHHSTTPNEVWKGINLYQNPHRKGQVFHPMSIWPQRRHTVSQRVMLVAPHRYPASFQVMLLFRHHISHFVMEPL
jgi:hypothetical protein